MRISYVTYAGNREADERIRNRKVLFIDNEVAQQVLTMEDTMEVIEEAYREYGLQRATASRATHHVPRNNGDGWSRWSPMASAIPKIGALAIRIKSDVDVPVADRYEWHCVAPGKYCGLILLYSTEDGAPLAILNDGHIQHMRVGAAGGLSVKLMAQEDASTLGLYGTAGMASTHAWAISQVRPIRLIKVYSPNAEHRRAFAQRISKDLEIEVVAVDTPRQVAEGADIIAACTNSRVPVFNGEWLAPGMHVLSVEPREFDDEVYLRSHRYVYSRTPTTEHYYAAPPGQRPGREWGGEDPDRPWIERERRLMLEKKRFFLSDLVLGNVTGRETKDEITCFTTQGIPIQFTATSYLVYQRAKEMRLGHELPLQWFLQDIRN